MNPERQMKVLLAPQVSEKATLVAESNNQHVFKVTRDASKHEIKAAVEQLFKVKVIAVRTLNMHGKNKRFGSQYGRRKDWKKAYVRLASGDDIDFSGGD